MTPSTTTTTVCRYKLAVTQETPDDLEGSLTGLEHATVVSVPPGWTLLTRDRATNKTVIVRNLPKRGIQRKRAGEKYAEDVV